MGNVVHTGRGRAFWPWSYCVLALAGCLLAGCGSAARKDVDLNTLDAKDDARQEELAALFAPPAEDWVYEIQAGDQVEVVFFTHPDQNRFVQVRPDGRITLPFVGDLTAAGRPPAELAAEIQERYQEVLVKPHVDVIVQGMTTPVYVMGEVRVPGEQTYRRKIDLVQAVAAAGGFSDEARLSNIVVLRRGPDGSGVAAILDFRSFMGNPDGPGNIQLRPYDVVWVPRDNLSRWDNALSKSFRGVLSAQDMVIKGWSLANFDEVFRRAAVSP